MKKLIPMPEIPQFRNAIKEITHICRFSGVDAGGDPIYNNAKLPILSAMGTVKLHGTNGSVCYNYKDGLWAQSKNIIITPLNDNAGFASFIEKNKDIFLDLMNEAVMEHRINTQEQTISIYGEWAGKGIQAGVGISELEKSFYIFGMKISYLYEDIDSFWVDSNIFNLHYNNIFHVQKFKIFEVDIDFNEPMFSNNKMVEMVLGVEKECPIAKHFGISGIGEGIVFEIVFNGNTYKWKMKGDKHAGIAKVKKVQKIDDVKLQKIIDVVDLVTPEWRLSQMYNETFDTVNGGKGDIKRTGDYLGSVVRDIMKEDLDIILGADLTPKEVNGKIAKKAREWFMLKLDEESGLHE